MSFLRTKSGLSNLRLFYNTEIIIFTEGGERSYTPSEIDDGNFNNQSVDVKFWRHILEEYGFDRKAEFRPIGSKTTAKYICESILHGEVRNVVVAMDRDLDSQLGNIFESPFILYTKGYSWENDVFTRDITLQQIESMLFLVEIPEDICIIVDDAYDDFRRIGKHLLKLEMIFREHGLRFISEFNGDRFFNGKKSPYIDREQVFMVLREKKSLIGRPAFTSTDTNKLCPLLNNYGKLIHSLSITIITYVCRKYGNIKSIPKDILTSSMIERFSNSIKKSADKYYHDLVRELQLNI